MDIYVVGLKSGYLIDRSQLSISTEVNQVYRLLPSLYSLRLAYERVGEVVKISPAITAVYICSTIG